MIKYQYYSYISVRPRHVQKPRERYLSMHKCFSRIPLCPDTQKLAAAQRKHGCVSRDHQLRSAARDRAGSVAVCDYKVNDGIHKI
jgi:hypothetical protein